MSAMTLKSLVEKLNDAGKESLETAVGLCFQRTHHTVEPEHLLKSMIRTDDPDLKGVLRYFNLDIARLDAQLENGLETFKTGSGATPSLAPRLVDLFRQCWLDTSIEFGEPAMRGATMLYSMLDDPAMAALTTRHAGELDGIDPARILTEWSDICATLAHETATSAKPAKARAGKEKHLAKYTIDLTAQASAGELDPVIGRDDEIRQVIDILTRRRQNNPILTGEAGVGKTAIVEGLARRITEGNVPDVLKPARLLTLDLALLQAGAGVKGEFENRLKGVIEEVKSSEQPIILFIDEAHNMVGAGGQAGQNDAANLLKPALARGELRTIAATTWAEYRKFFEKDAALTRRFQVVKVDEPDETTAIQILRGLVPTLEAHHGVAIADDALKTAVTLSTRFLASRQLPDKAVALLDTACARVAMSQASVPASVERAKAEVAGLEQELALLSRESRFGIDHSARQDALHTHLHVANESLARLETEWSNENVLVQEAAAISKILLEDESDEGKQRLNEIRASLGEREQVMVHWQVDTQLVSEVLSDWTGIPLGRMQSDDVASILSLASTLKTRVTGQDHALDDIARTIQVARAELADEKKPLGVFLLVGPSGVGKTETAMALAEQVYGSESNMTVINMSEFKEEHKVSQLVGSPPGYVGYGEGGVLTEAVRRKPYSVILLDEMEKAHPGVQDIFYQVFDKGSLRDGEGRDVDFRNTVLLMTSNAASEHISDLYVDELTAPEPEALTEAIWDDLLATFKPAFLGRTVVLPYRPLGEVQLQTIARMQLDRVRKRVHRQHGIVLEYDDSVVERIAVSGHQTSTGARNIQQVIQREILPRLSDVLLNAIANNKVLTELRVVFDNNQLNING